MAACSTPRSCGSPAAAFQRLPDSVLPVHYQLTLSPDLDALLFDGTLLVSISIKEDVRSITMNAAHLNVTSCCYTPDQDDLVSTPASTIVACAEDELLFLKFPSVLAAGTTGKLFLTFAGVLSDKLKGFYRCQYPNSVNRFAAATHFEPTGARFAFPCWDEPAIKATFEITLIVPKHLTALSNMPALSERVLDDGEGEEKEVTFAVTPLMSTYLLAFVVGDYSAISETADDGNSTLVSVYAPTGKQEQGSFALHVATRALAFYSKYFDMPFHLPKLDLIALSDFPIGAMENWGLVTYREVCLLADPVNTSAEQKESIALVVTHELSHMWFGNLVTMSWWTDLWLKEGFAMFIEYLCTDALMPELSVWMRFASSDYAQALDLDSLHNSHPIQVPVNDPSEVSEIFDAISYCKGASVIRVLHQYLGASAFKKGLRTYLKRHAYRCTDTTDLWMALAAASDKPVADVMSTWTKQKGYPVISVTEERKGDDLVLTLSQQMFTVDGKLGAEESAQTWMVPITIVTSTDPDTPIEYLLTEKSGQVTLSNFKPDSWFKLNKDSVGFYRVAYSQDMLERLSDVVDEKLIPVLDRLGVQSDLFALSRAGKRSTLDFLRMLPAYVFHDDFAVWSSICDSLIRLNRLLSHSEQPNALHSWGVRLFNPLFKTLGWDAAADENHSTGLLRSRVLGIRAALGDSNILTEARKRFEAHVKEESVIPVNLRSVVYAAVARDADDETVDALIRLHNTADQQEEKDRITGSLGRVRDVSLIARVLDFSISADVRNQDAPFIIGSVAASSAAGAKAASLFFQENVQLFVQRYSNTVLMGRLVGPLSLVPLNTATYTFSLFFAVIFR